MIPIERTHIPNHLRKINTNQKRVTFCEHWIRRLCPIRERLDKCFIPKKPNHIWTVGEKRRKTEEGERRRTLRTRLRLRLSLLLDEYLRKGYIHSVKLLLRPHTSLVDRSLWLVCITLCGVLMLSVLAGIWSEFMHSPSELVVEETEQATMDFPFPSVTICPRHKLRRSVALSFYKRAINGSAENERLISHALYAMEYLQLPIRTDQTLYLQHLPVDKIAALMEGVDIAMVFKEALPKCTDIFRSCLWAGREIDCCANFDYQLTTKGVCYAFNSFTSLSRLRCLTPDTEGCQLFSNSGTGSSSGLQVLLKRTNLKEQLIPEKPRVGFKFVVQSPFQVADVDRGDRIKKDRGFVTTAAVSYTTTRSSSWLETLPIEQRGCLLTHEWKARPNSPVVYSRESCLLQCRADFARDICGCQLYLAAAPEGINSTIPTCGVGHITCLAGIRPQLLFVVPNENGPGFSENERGTGAEGYPRCLDCRHACAPESYPANYFSQPSERSQAKEGSYLDVYLKDRRSAILYHEVVRIKPHRLLVSYGGICNLFLGMSVLSIVQVFFFLSRAVVTTIHVYFGDDFGHKLALRILAIARRSIGASVTAPKQDDSG